MDGEAGWWTTSGNIGLPPLARAMGVGRQQQQEYCQVCPKVWKLKDEETVRLFTLEMDASNDDVTKADDIQKKWLLVNETSLKGSK